MAVTPVKPRLRGVPHALAAAAAPFAGVMLVTSSPSDGLANGTIVYSLSMMALFTISAIYHTNRSSSSWLAHVLQRLDHSAIFSFIAGTYTPLCLCTTPTLAASATRMLTSVWLGAAAGTLRVFAWSGAPRILSTSIYLALGWAGASQLPTATAAYGHTVVLLLVGGGVLYAIGAVVYVRRKPNPWPLWFGFHEIFHMFTIAAAVLHYTAVWMVVARYPPVSALAATLGLDPALDPSLGCGLNPGQVCTGLNATLCSLAAAGECPTTVP